MGKIREYKRQHREKQLVKARDREATAKARLSDLRTEKRALAAEAKLRREKRQVRGMRTARLREATRGIKQGLSGLRERRESVQKRKLATLEREARIRKLEGKKEGRNPFRDDDLNKPGWLD